MSIDIQWMQVAFEQAQSAAERDEVPVGAVIVHRPSNTLVASAGNHVEAGCDPTAHAEILAIREACRVRGTKRLEDYDLHVTLEPCPMCAQAISHARIRTLYYGASDPKSGGVEHGPRVYTSGSAHHVPEVYSGIMAKECGALLSNYFKNKR